MVPQLVFAMCLIVPGQFIPVDGTIRGTVVNATQGRVPVTRTEVVLRAAVDGRFVPLAEATTDAHGRFLFTGLPVGADYLYLPGANRDGVHYPGKRIVLTREHPYADVELEVCDSVTHPSPLVIRRHEITIRPEPGVLKVAETIVVENPTNATYVGRPTEESKTPVTLRLAIPSDFDRTTFHKEFYGRRFSLVDERLVTGIPWTPGRRELKFTYTLPNTERHRLWERPLDLPCSHVRVRVETDKPEEVLCSLDRWSELAPGELVFESKGQTLPAGHVIRVELPGSSFLGFGKSFADGG